MTIRSTISPVLKIGLQFLGIWPDVSYSTIYWLSLTLSILIMQYFQYWYILKHLKFSELSNLIDGLTVTLDYSLTIFKLIGLWLHRRVFHQLLAAMDNDWRECINFDQHLYIMTINANISHFFSNAVLSVVTIIGILYLLGEYVIRNFVLLIEDHNDTLRQFPIKIYFPFETQQWPVFEFLFVTIFLHVILHVCVVFLINGLIFTLVLHISGQIDIMCHEFKNISESILLYKSSATLFGLLIKRHNRIISFSENIEKFFSFVALMQVVWNTLVICCLGFVIIISFHNGTGIFVTVKTIFACFAIIFEVFIVCFVGDYLRLKGELIASATYDSLWYNMSPRQSKIMLFIIIRSQKRLTFTAGKMMDMSLETFTNIMKASISYASVLNAMY
ncbi:odorant receptor 13a [Monomorium pharaonis]|uniref:odorant receptor 13a n=1 Tax=Monomorium pharaonis TaxID=307658 RepID=UPI0017463137|nr:odorant receptor 13a [Monomorium pharaonis]